MLAVITPLSRLGAIILGRKVRMWYKNLPEEEQRKFWNRMKKNQGNFVGLGFLGAVFALYLYVSHLEECPMTGRRRFVALTDEQISKIGIKEFDNLLEHFEGQILPVNAVAYSRVAKVVNQILNANKDLPRIHDKDWTITVVDSDMTNAFVLPVRRELIRCTNYT